MPTTLLSIDDINFSDYATRGLTVTLSPIDSGALERDVNGNLVDLTLPEFRKLQASIECTDHEAPTFDDVWRGKEVIVTFIPEVGVVNNTDGTLTLQMMVDSWQTNRDEYGADTGWTLSLIER